MAEKLKLARVFIGSEAKLNDTQCNAIVTSRTIPTQDSTTPYAWVQTFTKGAVSINVSRETQAVGNDQQGDTGVYIKSQPVTITVPFSEASFDVFAKYALLDPDWESGDTAGDYKENSGVELSGISMLIYDKDLDSTNETDTPDVTVDSNTQVFFEVVVDSDVNIEYNGEQGIVTVTFKALANTGTGSAKGKKGSFGTFSEES